MKLPIKEGDRFGRLTVIEFHGHDNGNRLYRCKCDCGKESVHRGSHMARGACRSCGCLQREQGAINGLKAKKHGMCDSLTYGSWSAMKFRCENSGHIAFAHYGGRGISVCERWAKFENFLADMGERPKGKSLERIDNSKGYTPDNCRWASSKEQARNRRDNRLIEAFGQKFCQSEWAEIVGIKLSTIRERLRRGWTAEESLLTPIGGGAT